MHDEPQPKTGLLSTMGSWSRIALAAATVALFAAPVAAAHDRSNGGEATVVPAGGEIDAKYYETFFQLPAAENPLQGHGNPCVRVGHHGKVLMAIARGGRVTCTAERGTMLATGSDHWCSDFFDPPGSRFYAVGRDAQRRCAKALSHEMTTLTVTVDGVVFDINKPRFADFTPLIRLKLPVGNIFEFPPQNVTMTAYGWTALVGNLRVGRHIIVVHVVDGDLNESGEHIIDIVRSGHSDEDGDGDN
jgi:hypothetical protein